jgi:hypothetical protein
MSSIEVATTAPCLPSEDQFSTAPLLQAACVDYCTTQLEVDATSAPSMTDASRLQETITHFLK